MAPVRLLGLTAFCAFALTNAALLAQNEKENPKKEAPKKEKEKPKVEKVVVTDPAKVPSDFAVQGEYMATEPKKFGAQVIALGAGNFDVVLLEGGLPGDGWDTKQRQKTSAATKDGKVTIDAKGFKGGIEGGKLKVSGDSFPETTFTKVERKSPTLGMKPPEGAVVLFDGASADEWEGGKVLDLSDGKVLNNGINSKRKFLSFKAHLEFRLPYMPNDRGQGRSNSGFYLQNRYEVQILDSFGLEGKNNECAALYTISPPSVNMCFPPLTWQTYDIDYTAAEYEGEKRVKDPVVTIYHNGVKVQDQIKLPRRTDGAPLKESPLPDLLHLQSHGNLVYFRNIWVVEKK